jgi:hypothetical protein
MTITFYDAAMAVLGGGSIIGMVWSSYRMGEALKAGKVKVVGIEGAP